MIYTALFRGINVGGQNTVKMAELRQMLLSLGLDGVKTYIQSGNAVFVSELERETLRRMICEGFQKHFGFDADVAVRSMEEIGALIDRLPFSAGEIEAAQAADPKVEHLYVYFLHQPPEPARFAACGEHGDGLANGDRELYLLCRQSIRLSKTAACAAKAFASATVRNWKTVRKLYEMMGKMQRGSR